MLTASQEVSVSSQVLPEAWLHFSDDETEDESEAFPSFVQLMSQRPPEASVAHLADSEGKP